MEERQLKYNEWFFQSDYDLDTAKTMLNTGRNVYCIFMCHLSLEKSLKALFIKQHNEFPPKIHNLQYFIDRINLEISDDWSSFLVNMDNLSVITRYPEDLRKMIVDLSKEKTINIYEQTEKIQQWLKQQ